MPRQATRPVDATPTTLQLDVVRALARPGTTLRWHSYIGAPESVRGRGQLQGTPVFADRLLPAYTVRQLVRHGLIAPADAASREPFAKGGAYRDYALTAKGRALVAHYPQALPCT